MSMPYQWPGNGSHGPDRYAGAPRTVPPQQQPLLPPSYRPVASPPQTNPLALASFICGLAGVALCWVSMLLPLAGVVGGVLGLVSLIGFTQEPTRYNNRWMAVAGIVCGGLCVLALIALTVLAAGFSSLPSQP